MSDFIAAACVGVAQISIGHPFDTTKILMQNNRKWFGLPFRNYYRGWRFPLCSAVILNSITFPTVERTKLYTHNSFLSGCIAGIAITPIVFCFDVGKIRQQTKQSVTIKTILNTRGRYSTFARETLASSVYFGSYFTCRDFGWHPLLSGGIAGLCNWTLTYPIDVIKSRQMAQNLTIKQALNMGNLWRGYPICATRAVIVNAIDFWVYESVKKYLSMELQ
jgi:hypothetical protein